MSKEIDLTGKVFGELTVLNKSRSYYTPCGTKKNLWKCRCVCGAVKDICSKDLRSGRTVSCGCQKMQKIKEAATKHGLCKKEKRLYNIWLCAKKRCFNEKTPAYKNYGGRGISMCEEWRNDFQSFYNWANANGYKENLTIDRIDNNGNYQPDNCRWTTMKEQANNTRRNHYIVCNGTKTTISKAAEKLGMNIKTLTGRIVDYKWSVERAISTPIRKLVRNG